MNEERRAAKGGIRTNTDGTAVTGINGSATGSLKGAPALSSHRRSSSGHRAKNNSTISDHHKQDYLSSVSRSVLSTAKHSGLDYDNATPQSKSQTTSTRRSGENFHANLLPQSGFQSTHAKGHQSLNLEGHRDRGHHQSSQASSITKDAQRGWEAQGGESSNVSSEEEDVEDEEGPSGDGEESDNLVTAHTTPIPEPVHIPAEIYSTSSNNSSSEDEEEEEEEEDEDAAAEEERRQQIEELKAKQKELRKKVRQLKHHQESATTTPIASVSTGKPIVAKGAEEWPSKDSPLDLDQKKSHPQPAHNPYTRTPSPPPYEAPSQGSTEGDSPLDLCVKKADTPSSAVKLQKELSITLLPPTAVASSTPLASRSPDRIILSVVPPSPAAGLSSSPAPSSAHRKTGRRRGRTSSVKVTPNQSSPSLNLSALNATHNHNSSAIDSSLLSNQTIVTGSPSISQLSDSESSLSLSQNSSCAVVLPGGDLEGRREKRKKLDKRKGMENSHVGLDGKDPKRPTLDTNSSSDSDSSGDSGSESSGDTERSAAASTASSSTAQTSSPMGLKRHHHSQKSTGSGRKRRRTIPEERELRIPLEHGWRRQTKIRCFSRSGVRGEVMYFGPCGKKLRNYPEVIRYLQRNGITDITRDNFCFSTKVNIGDFLERPPGGMPEECALISEQEVVARIEEVRRRKGRLGVLNRRIDSRKRITPEESEKQRKWEEIQMQRRLHQQAEESRRQKEQQKQSKSQEKAEKLHQLRLEKELQNQQAIEEMEAKRQQALLREQEREAKQQQALLREQELQKRREMLMLVDLERERRRQHMMLVRALETRKKQEERDKKREEFLQEKEVHRQKKLEQRRLEMQLIREIKKPVDDMMLKETTALPTLNRIPGLKVSGQAFSDLLMVFEFLHNFGESLGFDMDNLPTLNTLQLAVLNYDEKFEEELLSVVHHLLVCAIDDPGIPNPRHNQTVLGHTLREADITNNNVTEILRIYVTAMDKDSKICRWLTKRPFLSLNPTQKAAVLGFLCNELLCSRIIVRQIDNSIDAVNTLRKDKWIVEGQLRRLRAVQVRRSQTSRPKDGKDDDCKGAEGETSQSGAKKKKEVASKMNPDLEDDDDLGNDSGNESDETQETGQPSEGEDEEPEITNEELEKKIEKLSRQATQYQNKLLKACNTLRGTSLGQDRNRRRYWILPKAGGIFCEGLESAEAVPNENFPVESPEAFSTRIKEERKLLNEEKLNEAKDEKEKGASKKEKEESKVVKNKSASATKIKTEVGADALKVEVKEEEVKENSVQEPAKAKVVKAETKEIIASKEGEVTPVKKADPEALTPVKEAAIAQFKNIFPNLIDGKINTSTPIMDVSPSGVPTVPAHFGGDKNSWLLHSPLFASILANSMFLNGPVMTPGREINGSYLGGKNDSNLHFNPFMNDFASPDHFLKAMSDPQAAQQQQQQQQHKTWFSILPRIPCDKQSLVVSTPVKDSKTPPEVVSPSVAPKNSIGETASGSASITPSAIANLQLGLLNGIPPGILMHSFLAAHGRGYPGAQTLEENKPASSAATADSSSPVIGSPLFSQGISPSMLNHPKRAMLQRMQHDSPLPIPLDLQRGWWRITDAGQLRTLLEALHHRGIREKMLQKYVQKHLTHLCAVCISGQTQMEETELEITELERAVSKMPGGAPEPDGVDDWLSEVALRIDLATLDQVESLEEKVAGASMQIKVSLPLQGWKLPPKLSNNPTVQFKPACTFVQEQVTPVKLQVHQKEPNERRKKDKHRVVNGDVKDVVIPEESNEVNDEDSVSEEVKIVEVTNDETLEVEKAVDEEEELEVKPGDVINPIELAKRRLLKVEAAIERRYLRPPLGTSTELNLATMSTPSGTPGHSTVSTSSNHRESSREASRESSIQPSHQEGASSSTNSAASEVTAGLVKWRRAVANCFSSAQMAMCINALENCIAWDKSIMRASCQFCHNGDNEEMLLLCDGCDKGYHTYCFKPKMDTIPDGDWYCYECLNKATGDKVCVMCGKKGKLLECAGCPKTFHMNCLEPPVTKYPKGKWHCPGCGHKAPKKSSSKSKSSASHKEKEHKEPKEPKEPKEKIEKETPTPKRSNNNSNNNNSSNNNTSVSEAATPTAIPSSSEKQPKAKEPRKTKEKGNKDLAPCRIIMDELEGSEDAWPFLLPVNTKQFPTYRKVIKKPMDLSTIRNKLESGGYKCREDYVSDVRIIFDNCETFNEDDSPVGIAGHNLRGFFECRWIELCAS